MNDFGVNQLIIQLSVCDQSPVGPREKPSAPTHLQENQGDPFTMAIHQTPMWLKAAQGYPFYSSISCGLFRTWIEGPKLMYSLTYQNLWHGGGGGINPNVNFQAMFNREETKWKVLPRTCIYITQTHFSSCLQYLLIANYLGELQRPPRHYWLWTLQVRYLSCL